MTLRRTSLATTPFEMVETETGIQCTICLGYAKVYDTLAMIDLKSRRFGWTRFLLLTPWACVGYLRYAFTHIDCLLRYNDEHSRRNH